MDRNSHRFQSGQGCLILVTYRPHPICKGLPQRVMRPAEIVQFTTEIPGFLAIPDNKVQYSAQVKGSQRAPGSTRRQRVAAIFQLSSCYWNRHLASSKQFFICIIINQRRCECHICAFAGLLGSAMIDSCPILNVY